MRLALKISPRKLLRSRAVTSSRSSFQSGSRNSRFSRGRAFSHSAIVQFHRLISRTRRVRLWLLVINPSALAAGEKWVDIGYVFTTETSTPIEPDNLRRVWYPLRDEAGLDANRELTAWRHVIVGQSIMAGTIMAAFIKDGIDATSVEGAASIAYEIPNIAVDLATMPPGACRNSTPGYASVNVWRSRFAICC